MSRRRLSSEERALWSALARTVRPLRPMADPVEPPPPSSVPKASAKRLTPPPAAAPATPSRRQPAAVLDSGWEKRIRAGTIHPDMSIDLHGHTLSGAHVRLDQALAQAVLRGARVLLVVTGKPRKSAALPGQAQRGAIRAEIGHWLGRGAYADHIASVRVAHPRHGGDGALYIILRRPG